MWQVLTRQVRQELFNCADGHEFIKCLTKTTKDYSHAPGYTARGWHASIYTVHTRQLSL